MAEIARSANMTATNLYVYFDSKLAILYEVYRPWLNIQLEALAESTRKFRTPSLRIRRILIGLWSDIPAADHSFANALIEALAVVPEGAGKSNDLLADVERFITDLMRESLPEDKADMLDKGQLSHLLWMAFDGFVINRKIGDVRNVEAIADMMTRMLMSPTAANDAS